jgi:hypothetical protein
MPSLSANTVNEITVQQQEYGVQHKYHSYFEKKLGLKFTTPLKSDGYGVNPRKKIYMFNEFKKDLDFKNRDHVVRVLVQATYGLRKMFLSHKIVNVVFIADRNEFFVMDPKKLAKYFSLDINWEYSPSQAYQLKNELYDKLYNDSQITPTIYDVNEENLLHGVKLIEQISDNGYIKLKITPDNFLFGLNEFKSIISANYKLKANEWANLFTQILINPTRNDVPGVESLKFINTEMLGNVPLKSRPAWNKFWMMYERNYTLQEKNNLTSNLDRIIEDVVRRRQGEFFTPKVFVQKSHEYISSVFGEDWKNGKYFVWDCCWGTGNLTKDEKFSKLFVTTLHNEDIVTAKSSHYNDEAIVRQVFDFLNDPDEFLPKPIKEAIEQGKEIIFLINPPYATSNVAGNSGEDKAGTSQTEVNRIMKEEGGWGKSVQQLYTQFMYRIMKMETKTHICMFSKPTFLTGDAFSDFRERFLEEYEYKKGFVMDAKEFADVKTSWPLTFSIFENIK